MKWCLLHWHYYYYLLLGWNCIFPLRASFRWILGKTIYSPWVQGRNQAKTRKRILVHRKIYPLQMMVENGSPKLKALLGNLRHPSQALFPVKGLESSLCDLLVMRCNETTQKMETGRDSSFITVINVCSQNHWNLFKFSIPYLIQLKPELIVQGVNKEIYCFPETQKEI